MAHDPEREFSLTGCSAAEIRSSAAEDVITRRRSTTGIVGDDSAGGDDSSTESRPRTSNGGHPIPMPAVGWIRWMTGMTARRLSAPSRTALLSIVIERMPFGAALLLN